MVMRGRPRRWTPRDGGSGRRVLALHFCCGRLFERNPRARRVPRGAGGEAATKTTRARDGRASYDVLSKSAAAYFRFRRGAASMMKALQGGRRSESRASRVSRTLGWPIGFRTSLRAPPGVASRPSSVTPLSFRQRLVWSPPLADGDRALSLLLVSVLQIPRGRGRWSGVRDSRIPAAGAACLASLLTRGALVSPCLLSFGDEKPDGAAQPPRPSTRPLFPKQNGISNRRATLYRANVFPLIPPAGG